MFDDPSSLTTVILRFSHIVFGIIWLGHLYFLNLVNVPFQKDLDGELKIKINPKLLLRVFYWFRYGALYTFIFGWLLFGHKYMTQRLLFASPGVLSNRAIWMLFGGLLGSIMWFNVWFVIWPRQKKILGALSAGVPHADAAAMGATIMKISRLNLFLSGPMLFAMIVPNNYPGWSLAGILLASILGIGFWFGLVKRSFKIKTSGAEAPRRVG